MQVQRIIVGFVLCLTLMPSLNHAAESVAEDLTLLGLLSDWQYPDAKFGGAQMSDAAVTGISSVKCRALLTTPDPPEKVVAYYLGQLKVDSEGTPLGADEGERVTTDQAVVVQTNSENRELQLTVIHIHEQRSSTTLTISRSKTDQDTHIAWTHFRQASPQ